MLRMTITAICFWAVLAPISTVMAAAPQLITYQGRMIDASGEPVPDGTYDLSFSIFTAAVEGDLVWSETQTGIAVKDGLFSAVMGSVVPLLDSVFSQPERFLEVKIGQQVLGSRTQFSSVGYAHRIATVDGAAGGNISGQLTVAPQQFVGEGNALTIVDDDGDPVLSFTVDANDLVNVSLYDPADSKAGGGNLATVKALDISVGTDGRASIAFYDPADNINGVNGPNSKRIEMHKDGLIMFGETEADTALFVAPNGDIIGLGQITMGENSSSGVNTAVLGFNNDATGDSSSIGGGSANTTTGTSSTIGGGYLNQATGEGATIGGGSTNTANQEYSTVGGGYQNIADGAFATVPGGDNNTAGADHAYAAGHRAKAEHVGSFVWADHTDEDFVSTADDQFIIRAGGGVGIGTNNPSGVLEVVGPGGDTAVIFPDGAIGSSETANEPGIAAFRSSDEIPLDHNSGVMEDLAVTTITTPTEGFIIVRGGVSVELRGSYGRNLCRVQIDEVAGGSTESPFYQEVGTSNDDEATALIDDGSQRYYPVSTDRIYTKPAGAYEFRLEAMAHPNNSNGAITEAHRPYITALFVPTAYGDVVQ